MKLQPLAYLEGLNRPFDAFAGGAGIDNTLIIRGFYPPLPVFGNSLAWGGHIIDRAASASLPVLNVEELSIGAAEALLLALRLENRADSFGYAEMAAIYEAAAGIIGRESSDPETPHHPFVVEAGLLVLRDGSFAARTFRYRKLEAEARRLANDGVIDLKTAEAAVCLDPETLRVLASAAAEGTRRATASERRSLFRLFAEVARRDGLDAEGQLRLARSVFGATAPPARRGAAFRTGIEEALARLSRLRYPALSALDERFEAIRDAALSGSGVRLEPPPLFEGERFSVSFSFADRRSLDAGIRRLSGLRERCDELADLLR